MNATASEIVEQAPQPMDRWFARGCCWGMAATLFLAGVATLLDPSLQAPQRFWQTLLTRPGWFLTARWALVLAAVLGLGVAAAVRDRLLAAHPASWRQGMASWLFRVAQLALFVTALANVQLASIEVPYVRIDPQGNLWLGGLGLWALGSSLLGRGFQPRAATLCGILTGLALLMVPVASALGNTPLWLLAVALGSTLVGPLWLVVLGRHLGMQSS